MNARDNPFAPGAGTPPPELAGRSGIIDEAAIAFARAKTGRGKSMLLLGLRGVGKTVLLNFLNESAKAEGALTILLEAPEDQSLAQMLVPPLRSALMKLSLSAKAAALAKDALEALRGFATAFKVKVGDFEVGLKAPAGTADSGNLEYDLAALLEVVARAAKIEDRIVVLFVDEVQYLGSEELSALIVATHKLGQQSLPFLLIGAGLPQLAGLAGAAKSYAERLLDYPKVGALPDSAARDAIVEPLKKAQIAIEPQALEHIISRTHGYPYFLQEWAYQAWLAAPTSPITLVDAKLASKAALEHLDASFFKVRFDRLTPAEKTYAMAMAQLGDGPYRSGEIAVSMKRKVTAVAPTRDTLIKKGMIFSPQHGDTDFTVPMFAEFLRRTAKHQ